jgi:hypothetical protein
MHKLLENTSCSSQSISWVYSFSGFAAIMADIVLTCLAMRQHCRVSLTNVQRYTRGEPEN